MALSTATPQEAAATDSASPTDGTDTDFLDSRTKRGATASRPRGRGVVAVESHVPGEPDLVQIRSASRLGGVMGIFRQPPMRYQDTYVWLLLAASLDIILTWTVLYLGGSEVNWLADRVLDKYHFRGIIVFKFCLVVFVILMCEFIGRMRDQTGRRLAVWCVVINFFPVVWTITQLLFVTIWGGGVGIDDPPV